MLLFDAADKCSDIHGSFGLYVDYSVPLGHLPQDDRDDKADSLCYRDRVPDEIISEDERQEVDADEVEYDACNRTVGIAASSAPKNRQSGPPTKKVSRNIVTPPTKAIIRPLLK